MQNVSFLEQYLSLLPQGCMTLCLKPVNHSLSVVLKSLSPALPVLMYALSRYSLGRLSHDHGLLCWKIAKKVEVIISPVNTAAARLWIKLHTEKTRCLASTSVISSGVNLLLLPFLSRQKSIVFRGRPVGKLECYHCMICSVEIVENCNRYFLRASGRWEPW